MTNIISYVWMQTLIILLLLFCNFIPIELNIQVSWHIFICDSKPMSLRIQQNRTGVRIRMTKWLLLFILITHIDFRRKIYEWIFGIYFKLLENETEKNMNNIICLCMFFHFDHIFWIDIKWNVFYAPSVKYNYFFPYKIWLLRNLFKKSIFVGKKQDVLRSAVSSSQCSRKLFIFERNNKTCS